MNQNQKTSIEPINVSSSEFGVEFENQFVVLDDAKHVIGVNGNNESNLILENLENGSTIEFKGGSYTDDFISTLVYHEKIGFLYGGNYYGYLYKYKLDTKNKTCELVKYLGNLKIGWIRSSHRFLHFVFFGGDQSKIKVLDLSTDKLLPGCLETSIKDIYSL